jgi:uncharacterized membrane protein YgdD (TMEM256/DUF423 family)
MQVMGLQAIYPKRRTTVTDSAQRKYPYLLRELEIVRPNQVWSTDITYVPLAQGFLKYLANSRWTMVRNENCEITMNTYTLLTMLAMFVAGVCIYYLKRRYSMPGYLFYLINFFVGIIFGYLFTLAYGLPFSGPALGVMAVAGWLGLQFAWVVLKYRL